MKYLMLIYGNEAEWASLDPAALAQLIGEVDAFNATLRSTGELVGVEGLVPEAKSIRGGTGAPVVTDGPYLEAKEFVGSYFVVDVDTEQRALEIAQAYPGLNFGGGLEMWPLMEHRGGEV